MPNTRKIAKQVTGQLEQPDTEALGEWSRHCEPSAEELTEHLLAPSPSDEPPRKPSPKELLHNAEQLADFGNAKTDEQVEYFHANNQGFFPRDLWTGLSMGTIQIVRKDALERDCTLSFLSPLDLREWILTAWQEKFPEDRCIILLTLASAPQGKVLLSPSPFHRAVMFLARESWRARFCGHCGECFVADKQPRRYCSLACTGQARRASVNAWWNEHGKQWREKTQTRARGRANRRRKTNTP